MTEDRDLEPFAESLTKMFNRLGLPHPRLMSSVSAEWEELAGRPWAGRSRPTVIRGATLVVEATTPSMVAFLRYGTGDLLHRLADRFGEGVITDVEVVPPGRI